MDGSGIRWPSGPFSLPDARKLRQMRLGGWALILGAMLMVALLHGRDRWVPQNLADLAATLGFGRTIDGAAVESLACGPYARDSLVERFQRGPRNECSVNVRGSISHDYDFRTGYRGGYAPGRVAMIGGRVAVAWPGWVMVERLTNLAVSLIVAGVMIVSGILALRAARAADRFAAPTARVVDVDLLRRKLLAGAAVWDFAYDHEGRRVLRRAQVREDPVITDGVVTRGAAILAPGGDARLLTVASAPAVFTPEIQQAISRAFHALRPPLDPRFADLIARTPPGPEREFVTAFVRAWHAPEVPQINAAIAERHDAALALAPGRVDHLLRECRRCIPRGG